jgi:hypothetical protein
MNQCEGWKMTNGNAFKKRMVYMVGGCMCGERESEKEQTDTLTHRYNQRFV